MARLNNIALIVALASLNSTVTFAQNVGQPAASAATSNTISAEAAKAWGHDKSDVKPDPAVLYGVLSNGMKYAIMRNETPKEGASVRMRFEVGSMAEADDQRGLAHFLEHMAFNGSKKISEGELIKKLERLGLAFGAHTNAATGFDSTVYQLDTPKTSNEHIDTALMVMRETASELTISPQAVDRERGVVMNDARQFQNASGRSAIAYTEFVFPRSTISKRFPAGIDSVIQNAPAQRIRDLYEKYYEPKRTTLVFVGDIDPLVIEQKIKAQFSDWKGKAHTPEDFTTGSIDPQRPFAAKIHVDSELPTSIDISYLKPYGDTADTVAERRKSTITSIATSILRRRFSKLAQSPDAPFISASIGNDDVFKIANSTSLNASAKDHNWARALSALEQEVRRARLYGFTKAELDEQIANWRTDLKNAVAQATTRSSRGLAGTLIGYSRGDGVFSTEQSALDRFEATAKTLTTAHLNAAFNELFQSSEPLIFITHNAPLADPEVTVAKAYEASKAVAVAAPVEAQLKKFAHTDFGAAGKVKTDRRIAPEDIRTLKFANNVMLNIKKTDFQKGVINISVRIAGGWPVFPKSLEGADIFFSRFHLSGTNQHSWDELRTIFAGKSVSAGFGASPTAFTASIGTTSTDLELQMQTLAAFLTAPGYRTDSEATWSSRVDNIITSLSSSPTGVLTRDLGRIATGENVRFGVPAPDKLKSLSISKLRPYIDGAFRSNAIEIGVVGDIDEQKVIDAVAKTFGALPMRNAKPINLTTAEKVTFTKDLSTRTLYHDGKAEQGYMITLWPSADGFDEKVSITQSLLSQVMGLRMTEIIRETLGASYSPGTSANASTDFKGYGYLSAEASMLPKDKDLVLKTIDEIAQSMIDKPATDDELKRAKEPFLQSMRQSKRQNGYWLALTDEAQTEPKAIWDARKSEGILNALTATDLQAMAKLYLQKDRALRVIALPKSANANTAN